MNKINIYLDICRYVPISNVHRGARFHQIPGSRKQRPVTGRQGLSSRTCASHVRGILYHLHPPTIDIY